MACTLTDPHLTSVHCMCSVGHKGKFGHEFMEFEFRPDGRLRYANNSNYKNDAMIRKECKSPCSNSTNSEAVASERRSFTMFLQAQSASKSLRRSSESSEKQKY